MKLSGLLLVFGMIGALSFSAEAKTVSLPAMQLKLKTELQLNNAEVYLYCSSDKWSGDGDLQVHESDLKSVRFTPVKGGYRLEIPAIQVSYSLFFRKDMGCGLVLNPIDGFDPKLGVRIENDGYGALNIGGSRNADSSELIEGIREVLKNPVCGALIDEKNMSRPTFECN